MLLALLCIAGLVAFYAGWQAAILQSRLWQHIYPFASSAFAVLTIFALVIWSERFQARNAVADTGYYLGKVSYTIYLFHLPVILILRPQISALPLSVHLAIYTAVLVLFCTGFYFSFEEPILRARPHYPRLTQFAEPARPFWRGVVARIAAARMVIAWRNIVLAACTFAMLIASIAAVERFQQKNLAAPFYISLVVAAALLIAFLHMSRLWRVAFLREASVAILIFSLLLPAADALVQSTRSRKSAAAIVPV